MKTAALCAALTAAMVSTAALAQAPAPPAPPARGPSLELSIEAAREAMAVCQAKGFKVAASVVDSAGVLRALLATDGTGERQVTSSTQKAINALKTGQPSSKAQARAASDPAYAAEVAADKTQIARAGAVPMLVGGVTIGAIGVGGARPGEVDEECAAAAAAKIAGRLR